ncbi:MAG: FHA domain-containing protein [Lachnospiraceae bacterium]|nr:FHA domain-containing protein [Lachnospiraceae bacterium]
MPGKKQTGKKCRGWAAVPMLFLFVIIFSLAFNFFGSAQEETEKTEEQMIRELRERCGSIVRVESICWDGESVIYGTKSFSGFVVTNDTSGAYVLTIQDGLTWTTEEKEEIRSQYALEDNARISEKIEVVFEGDLRIEASSAGESEQRNLTALKLSQSVQFETVLIFAAESASKDSQIFLLSFPESVREAGDPYNSENVQITQGTVTKIYQENGNEFLKHDIPTDTESFGGPLLDEDGSIVGLLLTSGEDGGTAVSAETIKSFLDTFEISYEEKITESRKQGIPILNIVLGVVAAVLLAAVILRGRKAVPAADGRGEVQNGFAPGSDKESSGRKGLKKGKLRQKGSQKGESGRKGLQKGKPGRKGSESADFGQKEKTARIDYPDARRAAIIGKAVFVIGRSEESDFAIPESRAVSRRHAVIQREGSCFYLTDLQSSNHTFLNGRQLVPDQKYALNDGDEIVIGKERLFFYLQL